MVRLFHVYYPVRTLVLLVAEALLVCFSFVTASLIQLGPDSFLVLNYEYGIHKILGVTAIAMLCAYYLDLYDPHRHTSGEEEGYLRLLVVLGIVSITLAILGFFFREFMIRDHVFLVGLLIMTVILAPWRWGYFHLMQIPALQEKVLILGSGARAKRLFDAIKARPDLGMEVVGFGEDDPAADPTRESLALHLNTLRGETQLTRLIVAMPDRRGTLPVQQLLDFRLQGIQIEEATTLLERISGKLEVESLLPSSLIFSEGFRVHPGHDFARRVVALFFSSLALIIALPLIPFVALAVRLSSPGPILFRQERVGKKGKPFKLFKFRSMRIDAEKDGPQWASAKDPRVTPVGRFLRATRLDELPQLWNVFKGDMGFVGPRPERPEFVTWLENTIPYYKLRHVIRPGLTGWAQVNYEYGASVEDAKEKLAYDLFYIKNMSVSLDLLIVFRTVKTVIFGRGR